jgi:hypothetical protein
LSQREPQTSLPCRAARETHSRSERRWEYPWRQATFVWMDNFGGLILVIMMMLTIVDIALRN